MLIQPFLHGAFFDRDVVETMNHALVDACRRLGILAADHDPAVEVLAMRIIKQARAGVRDRELLTAAALDGLARRPSQ